MSDVIVEAPVMQVVSGSVLTSGETYPCCRCGRLLRDGDSVIVYAGRCAKDAVWCPSRVCCASCGPEGIATPTLGVVEALLSGRVYVRTDGARQQTSLVGAVESCLAVSDATKGSM